MKVSSTDKLLYLLNLLIDDDYTKAKIIEKFSENGVNIQRSLITNYIERFHKCGIDIKSKVNEKREKVYYYEKKETDLFFTKEEMQAISDAKKILISQKNYDRIRKTMRLFYKLSRYIKDEDDKLKFIDFGYYSTINWNLLRRLEWHCKNKDVVSLDYILPTGGNKTITMRADSIKTSTWSNRIHLHGLLCDRKYFMHLPIDRIYMVKEVIKEKESFSDIQNNLIYKVSKKIYEKSFVDDKEQIIETNKDVVTIKRPIDDEFYIIQRLLSFCPMIYDISNERIKMLLKEKLELVKALYSNEIDR